MIVLLIKLLSITVKTWHAFVSIIPLQKKEYLFDALNCAHRSINLKIIFILGMVVAFIYQYCCEAVLWHCYQWLIKEERVEIRWWDGYHSWYNMVCIDSTGVTGNLQQLLSHYCIFATKLVHCCCSSAMKIHSTLDDLLWSEFILSKAWKIITPASHDEWILDLDKLKVSCFNVIFLF